VEDYVLEADLAIGAVLVLRCGTEADTGSSSAT
jgi:hypothetical protein